MKHGAMKPVALSSGSGQNHPGHRLPGPPAGGGGGGAARHHRTILHHRSVASVSVCVHGASCCIAFATRRIDVNT